MNNNTGVEVLCSLLKTFITTAKQAMVRNAPREHLSSSMLHCVTDFNTCVMKPVLCDKPLKAQSPPRGYYFTTTTRLCPACKASRLVCLVHFSEMLFQDTEGLV